MTAADLRAPAGGRFAETLSRVPPAVWAVAGAILVAARDLAANARHLANRLGDTDDAARLVQVREWLAGAPWFDPHTGRFGLADGLASHWSRLIDAPIGALILLLQLVLPPAEAETAARALWPLLLLVPLFALLAMGAERWGGRLAAGLAIAFAAVCLPGLVQFAAGRIDHHNVMIVAALGAILFAARAEAEPRLAFVAGLLAGLGLAVGYEGLALVLALFACVGLGALADRRGAALAARLAAGAALALAGAFAATVAPAQWGLVRCDALSLNVVLAAGAGAAGCALMASPRLPDRPLARLLAGGAAVLAAGLLYAAAEPACLAGPFGQVDPAVKRYWLDRVIETEPLIRFFRTAPADAASFVLLICAGLAAQVALWRRAPGERGLGLLMAMMAAAAALAAWQIKLLPYAVFLALVPLAAFVARLPGLGGLSPATVRFLAAVLVNPMTLHLAAEAAVRSASAERAPSPSMTACLDGAALKLLDRLPAGLVVAPIDLGPFLAAFTRHRALAAPYHRLNGALLAHEAVWTGSDMAEVERRLRALGAAYVVNCPALDPELSADGPDRRELRARLTLDEAPGFLEEVRLPGLAGSRVYRLKEPLGLRGSS